MEHYPADHVAQRHVDCIQYDHIGDPDQAERAEKGVACGEPESCDEQHFEEEVGLEAVPGRTDQLLVVVLRQNVESAE